MDMDVKLQSPSPAPVGLQLLGLVSAQRRAERLVRLLLLLIEAAAAALPFLLK